MHRDMVQICVFTLNRKTDSRRAATHEASGYCWVTKRGGKNKSASQAATGEPLPKNEGTKRKTSTEEAPLVWKLREDELVFLDETEHVHKWHKPTAEEQAFFNLGLSSYGRHVSGKEEQQELVEPDQDSRVPKIQFGTLGLSQKPSPKRKVRILLNDESAGESDDDEEAHINVQLQREEKAEKAMLQRTSAKDKAAINAATAPPKQKYNKTPATRKEQKEAEKAALKDMRAKVNPNFEAMHHYKNQLFAWARSFGILGRKVNEYLAMVKDEVHKNWKEWKGKDQYKLGAYIAYTHFLEIPNLLTKNLDPAAQAAAKKKFPVPSESIFYGWPDYPVSVIVPPTDLFGEAVAPGNEFTVAEGSDPKSDPNANNSTSVDVEAEAAEALSRGLEKQAKKQKAKRKQARAEAQEVQKRARNTDRAAKRDNNPNPLNGYVQAAEQEQKEKMRNIEVRVNESELKFLPKSLPHIVYLTDPNVPSFPELQLGSFAAYLLAISTEFAMALASKQWLVACTAKCQKFNDRMVMNSRFKIIHLSTATVEVPLTKTIRKKTVAARITLVVKDQLDKHTPDLGLFPQVLDIIQNWNCKKYFIAMDIRKGNYGEVKIGGRQYAWSVQFNNSAPAEYAEGPRGRRVVLYHGKQPVQQVFQSDYWFGGTQTVAFWRQNGPFSSMAYLKRVETFGCWALFRIVLGKEFSERPLDSDLSETFLYNSVELRQPRKFFSRPISTIRAIWSDWGRKERAHVASRTLTTHLATVSAYTGFNRDKLSADVRLGLTAMEWPLHLPDKDFEAIATGTVLWIMYSKTPTESGTHLELRNRNVVEETILADSRKQVVPSRFLEEWKELYHVSRGLLGRKSLTFGVGIVAASYLWKKSDLPGIYVRNLQEATTLGFGALQEAITQWAVFGVEMSGVLSWYGRAI